MLNPLDTNFILTQEWIKETRLSDAHFSFKASYGDYFGYLGHYDNPDNNKAYCKIRWKRPEELLLDIIIQEIKFSPEIIDDVLETLKYSSQDGFFNGAYYSESFDQAFFIKYPDLFTIKLDEDDFGYRRECYYASDTLIFLDSNFLIKIIHTENNNIHTVEKTNQNTGDIDIFSISRMVY